LHPSFATAANLPTLEPFGATLLIQWGMRLGITRLGKDARAHAPHSPCGCMRYVLHNGKTD